MTNTIEHQGIIISIDNNVAHVKIEQTSACASCHVKTVCGASEKSEKIIDANIISSDLKVGDTVRWMCPLDHDYTYGEILSIKKSIATVKVAGLYKNTTEAVHLRYIEKLVGGKNCGDGKRNNKLLITKGKL